MRQILQLYESTATAIDGYAHCSLPDALSCEVTEERNGEYWLEMTYPASGLYADEIKVGRIIAAKPHYMASGLQGFRISEIQKTIEGEMTVTAYHVSYDLSQVIVMPFTASTLAAALAGLVTYGLPSNAFTFDTDTSGSGTFTVTTPTPLRQLLVGSEGSIVDVFGGEWEFDNWTATLHASRGETRNVQIAYAKNLTGFTETDSLGKYDAVIPYAVYNDTTYYITDTSVVSTAPVVYADGSGAYFGFPRALTLDLSDKFTDAAPTDSTLYSYAAAYIARNALGSTANYSAEFVDLAKILGSRELIYLCDTIYITVKPFNVYNLTSKVISVTYDVLTDENTAVEVGDRKTTLADTLAATIQTEEQATGAVTSTDQIPYIVGTQTASTNAWTGVAPFGELKTGQAIRYRLPYAGTSSAATLNLTLADGTTTGAKTVYRLASTSTTTNYGAGCVILMTYNGTAWQTDAYVAGSNSIGYQLRTASSTLPVSGACYRYRLLFTSADGTKWVPANTSTSTNATSARSANQTPIDPFGEIVYYGTTTALSSGSSPSVSYLWQQYTLTLGYSFNVTGSALTLSYPAKVYVKATPQSDGSAIIDSTEPFTQNLPSSADGYIYIELGIAYSATQIELKMKHPVYYHNGTGIRLFTGGAI